MAIETKESPTTLNAMLNLFDENHQIQFDKDKEAARQFFLQDINKNTVYFNSLEEKVDYLVENNYWDKATINKYDMSFIKQLFKDLYNYKHRFRTYLGALKFYNQYALKTREGDRYLERWEDRCAIVGLYLGDGDENLASNIAESIMRGQFQPATPTFQNSGKTARGGLTSCFLLDMQDNIESIMRTLNSAAVLSKNGGGIGVNFTNLRETGAPIKDIDGLSSGIVPSMKMFEDTVCRYFNQLGTRQGSMVANLNIFHPDIEVFLDTKKENADEGIRMRLLSIAVLIPDVFMQEAAKNHDIPLFSPYEIKKEYGVDMSSFDITANYQELLDNPNISKKKKINARKLLARIAEVQSESGYPYMIFIDNANNQKAVDGRIKMSNLCVVGDSEILTENGYRNVKDLYQTQEDITVMVDNRVLNKSKIETGVSPRKSTKMLKTADQAPVFTLRTKEGYNLTATGYHKFYMIDKYGKLVKKELLDLCVGDKVLIQSGEGFSKTNDSNNFSSKKPYNTHKHLATISSIEYAGIEPVYDVTVDDPSHSLIFNGIVTGNCSEIFQPQTPSILNEDYTYRQVGMDVACNLGSLIIDGVMDSGKPEEIISTAIRALTKVADTLEEPGAPTVEMGNHKARSIGLSAMNLHGYLARESIHYGSEEALDFVSAFFAMVRFYSLKESNKIATERWQTFEGFTKSKYATGEFFDKYIQNDFTPKTDKVSELFSKADIKLPTQKDWEELKVSVMESGLYHRELMAQPPTGSISYVQSSTPGLMPIPAIIETRKESMVGRVYYPQPYMTNDNLEFYGDAYELGYKKIIDTFAASQQHIDQGQSMNLYFNKNEANTRTINKAQIYAWKMGLKSTYYVRFQQEALTGTEVEDCVSCSI